MKKRLLTIVFTLFIINHYLNGQTTITNAADKAIFYNFVNSINNHVNGTGNYVCSTATGTNASIVSHLTFDTLFKPIFGKVIFANNDLVNQGSAYTLAVNQFESKFGINYNWAMNKNNPTGNYFNIGFSASSSSKVVPLFSKDEWQQGLGLSFGVTLPYGKKIYFYPNECSTMIAKRKAASINWMNEIRNTLIANAANLTTNIQGVENFYATNAGLAIANYDNILSNLTLQNQKAVDDAQALLAKAQHLRTIGVTTALVDAYVESLITKFEKENFTSFEYSFSWWNIAVKPEYKGINIYDTSAAKTIGINKKDFFRLGLDATWNYARSKKNLFLVQAGVGVRNTNYLEGKKPDEVKFLQSTVTPSTDIVEAGDATIVSNYDKYKKQFALLTPNAGFDWFWGSKRMFGWEMFLSTKLGLEPKEVEFNDLFTFRTGLLFSINGKTDLAKSTFGLIAQWEDLPFKKPSISDNFTFSIRIGIPFNF